MFTTNQHQIDRQRERLAIGRGELRERLSLAGPPIPIDANTSFHSARSSAQTRKSASIVVRTYPYAFTACPPMTSSGSPVRAEDSATAAKRSGAGGCIATSHSVKPLISASFKTLRARYLRKDRRPQRSTAPAGAE